MAPKVKNSKNDIVIDVKDLVKVYDNVKAVAGISFQVRRGQVFAFLGPNGAGKTTSVEIIETIRSATSGKVRMFGLDVTKAVDSIKPRIGVLPQEFSSFDKLTVRETIQFYADLYDTKADVDRLVRTIGLKEHRDKLYQNLSGGLKQRVGIAVALANDPEVVFLDEPTTGLDPASRREVWSVIEDLAKTGKTVFLTTHYMEEAEYLADHVAIIHKGRIIAEGTVNDLITEHGEGLILTFKDVEASFRSKMKEAGVKCRKDRNGCAVLPVSGKKELLDVLATAQKAGAEYKEIDVRRSNLEEVFLKLTGKKLVEADAK